MFSYKSRFLAHLSCQAYKVSLQYTNAPASGNIVRRQLSSNIYSETAWPIM